MEDSKIEKKYGRGKIHEHPNAGKSTFKERPNDINRLGAGGKNSRFTTKFFNDHYKDIEGLTKADFVNAISKLLEMNESDWTEIELNSETPNWIKFLVADLRNPKSRSKAMADVLDRIFGKAKEEYVIKGEMSHDVTTNFASPIQVIINGQPK